MNGIVVACPGKPRVIKNVDGARFQATFDRMGPLGRRYTRNWERHESARGSVRIMSVRWSDGGMREKLKAPLDAEVGQVYRAERYERSR
jgi:hypothetical protein